MKKRQTSGAKEGILRRPGASFASQPEPPAEKTKPAPAAGPPKGGTPKHFPIVGVGASAGGLEAFRALLKHLPTDTGMGFVLVQHLDPQHESALSQILMRATSMPVREVTNNLRVEANHVYVIAPNTDLSMEQGVLKLRSRTPTRSPPRSIDTFFESLAQDQRERAIGVILSGTATDGTLGLEAIKGEGGITFAQDESAKYDSMPRSAVAAGCVDFVLSPENIAKELARIARHPYVAQPPEAITEEDVLPKARKEDEKAARGTAGENGYKKILLLLRNHSGVDFSLYKSSTIQRRIARRIVLNKKNTLEEYADFLRGNAKELDALYSDALISVTSFFRNPEAFDVLQRKVFPRAFERRGDEPFRVWVLGCSTGQEAYSIAMAFVECAEKSSRMRQLQVFATDLNDRLLDKARHGLYARNLAQDVSPERLRRFFVEEEGGYRVNKALRDMVVFARQNLISDPPFSRMDLISCRNLLIYLEPSLQQKALPTFHYALKPEGFLFLGASESVGAFTDLFEPVDKKHKIYTRKAAPTPAIHLPARREHDQRPSPPAPLPSDRRGWPRGRVRAGQGEGAPEGFPSELSAQREADRVTVNQFAPPGVLINDYLQILQFRGPTSAYLEPPTGKASFEVLKMAREGLMLPLRAAINKARKENKIVRKENVRVNQNGKTRTVTVEVIPLKNLKERCFLILFEDAGRGISQKATKETKKGRKETPPALPPVKSSRRVAELESELAETRDYVQSIQEQHEAVNEELQASNEEVTSANEELQSVNEELETSKEELESANEELTTVNEEMANRNAELNRLNSDLVNLQTSTKLPIVLLGRDLTIRRFSGQAEKQFGLLAADVGRPISHIRHNLNLLDLEALAAEVIANVRECEREVQDKEGRWHSLRVRPYMTLDNKVDGAVLVLVDIDAVKQRERLEAALDFAQSTVDTVREPLLVLDGELRVRSAGRSFYNSFGASPAETIGRFIYDLGNGQWNIPKLRELLEHILPENAQFNDFEVEHNFENLGPRTMLLNARRLEDAASGSRWILLAIEDVTERKRADELLQQRTDKLQEAVGELEAFSYSVAHDLRAPLRAMQGYAQALLEQAAGQLTPQNQSYVERIQRAAARLDLLTQEVLTYSRLARTELQLHPVNLEQLTREVIEQYPEICPPRAQIEIRSPLLPVMGHEALLTQVLCNLLVNACKFVAPDTVPKVVVRTETVGKQVRIWVEDNGIGIAPEHRDRLFKIFGRIHPEHKYEGTGIGLAIVKKAAERMGGTAGFESEPGNGSRFWVQLNKAE